jgi:hypothetical protein
MAAVNAAAISKRFILNYLLSVVVGRSIDGFGCNENLVQCMGLCLHFCFPQHYEFIRIYANHAGVCALTHTGIADGQIK